MHHHLGFTVKQDSLLEGLQDHVRTLGIIDPVSHDETRAVVNEDQCERVGPVDIALDKIEMPEVIGAHGLVAAVVGAALDLGRTIARALHHSPDGVHADFDILVFLHRCTRAWCGVWSCVFPWFCLLAGGTELRKFCQGCRA